MAASVGSGGMASPPRRGGSGRRSGESASALVGAGILISRISGLVRERAVGHFFGTGFAADAFTAANRLPNLLQNLLGEGALSASIIPTYARLLDQDREEDAGRVAGAVAGLLAAVVGLLVVVVVTLARPLTAVLAPGLAEETFELTVTLVRIITPGVGFLVLSAWCLGILNSHRRFFLSYVAPALMNVAQVAALVLAAALFVDGGLDGGLSASAQSSLAIWLGWGTALGGLLQFAVQLPTVIRLVPSLRPSLRTKDPEVREVVRSFVPIVASRGVVHLSGYLQLVIASFLALGALSALRYAQMLYVLPVSLFGMAVAAAELPELSTLADAGAELRARVDAGLARIVFFVAPTMVAYVVAGDFIVAALFQSGEFDRSDVVQVWVILAVHALGLLATTGSRLLQSVLYGLGRARTPARIAMIRVALALTLGLVLMFQLDRVVVGPDGLEQIGDLPALSPLPEPFRDPAASDGRRHLGAVGLALAAAVSSFAEYWLLRRALRSSALGITIVRGRWRVMTAAAVSGVTALALRPVLSDLAPLLAGALMVSLVGAVYLVVAWRLGVPESRKVVRLVARRARGGSRR